MGRHEMSTAINAHFSEHLSLPSYAGSTSRASTGVDQDAASPPVAGPGPGYEVRMLASRHRQRRRPGIVLGYGAIPTARIEEGLRQLRACFDG